MLPWGFYAGLSAWGRLSPSFPVRPKANRSASFQVMDSPDDALNRPWKVVRLRGMPAPKPLQCLYERITGF